MTALTAQTTQVYQVFIKASPEQIWDAITKPRETPGIVCSMPDRELGTLPASTV
jgi:uncharacterized protein YndB with AHSA1/START domain